MQEKQEECEISPNNGRQKALFRRLRWPGMQTSRLEMPFPSQSQKLHIVAEGAQADV
jgi:hypothetical protein